MDRLVKKAAELAQKSEKKSPKRGVTKAQIKRSGRVKASLRTISRRFKERAVGFKPYKEKILLSADDKAERLKFAKKHVGKTPVEWNKVLHAVIDNKWYQVYHNGKHREHPAGMLRACWGHPGSMLGACCGHAAGMLGACWNHAVGTLGACCGHIASMLDASCGRAGGMLRQAASMPCASWPGRQPGPVGPSQASRPGRQPARQPTSQAAGTSRHQRAPPSRQQPPAPGGTARTEAARHTHASRRQTPGGTGQTGTQPAPGRGPRRHQPGSRPPTQPTSQHVDQPGSRRQPASAIGTRRRQPAGRPASRPARQQTRQAAGQPADQPGPSQPAWMAKHPGVPCSIHLQTICDSHLQLPC